MHQQDFVFMQSLNRSLYLAVVLFLSPTFSSFVRTHSHTHKFLASKYRGMTGVFVFVHASKQNEEKRKEFEKDEEMRAQREREMI